jgi:hypothetical protein
VSRAERADGAKRRPTRGATFAVVLLALPLLALNGEPYRFARDVRATPGWSVLDLPDEVLALARPGLADVRLETPRGELGYVLEEALSPVAPRVELHNLERVPGRETTALLDRGATPARCRELELEIAGGEPFLKPLVVETSPDGKDFQELARGSIFRVESGQKRTRLSFVANDRRFLRLRFDDRNGSPVQPVAARCLEVSAAEPALREVAVKLERAEAPDERQDTYLLKLPSANLPVAALHFVVGGLAFARDARVYERILFRGELSRRLVGSGRLERSATGAETLAIPVSELSGSALELEIERSGTPLDISGARALVRPKRLVFVAPDEPGLTLRYGSLTATAPSYDLGGALARGRPATLTPATLGPARDSRTTAKLPAPSRAALDRSAWKRRAALTLPDEGSVAYLDLDGPKARAIHAIRIVDAQGRQVPFLVESEPRLEARPLKFASERRGTTTRVTLTGLDPAESLASVELHASAPAYFERTLRVLAEVEDRRGVVGERELASVIWRKRPETRDARVALPISVENETRLLVEIADGDNAPLTLTKAVGFGVRRRIDFLFEPGERLELVWDNPAATAPRYDLDLIATTVLESPALPALLEKQLEAPARAPEPGTPRWFWWVIVGSGLVVVFALFRVRRAD